MSSDALPFADGPAELILVEPRMDRSFRADQLGGTRFRVTQTDCALDIFMMRHTFRFTMAVLNDRIGVSFLCAAAENVRSQWPLARILILGQVPAEMNDQLYDELALHSVDGSTLLSTIERLAEDPWNQRNEPLSINPRRGNAPPSLPRASELRESDPTKLPAPSSSDSPAREVPSGQNRSHRRGYYAFPPSL